MIYLKASVGIEIRDEDLVITCLRSNFSGAVFTDYKRISGYRTREISEVAREMNLYFEGKRLSRENIILGIPRKDVILRHLDLPKEVEDNLPQVVLYQVQSFEPTEEQDFYYDYVRMGSAHSGKRLQILLVMIRKPVLDGHLDLLRKLGIRPASVTVGSVALANLFLQGGTDTANKTFILADLRPGGIEILALRNGSLALAGEATKKEDESWKDLLLREVELTASRIRMGTEETIERIVLSGESSEAARQELLEEISECELLSSRLRFEMPTHHRGYVQEGASSLALAHSGIVGRPLFGLNLLPPQLRVRHTRWAYVPTALLGLLILALSAGLGLRNIIQERKLGNRLDQETQALKGRVDEILALRTQVEDQEKKIQSLEAIFEKRSMNLEILQELTTILPSDTFLNVYQNRDCTIQLGGSSPSTADLIPKLERSRLLRDVQQRGTIFKDPQTGKDRFNFEAKCER